MVSAQSTPGATPGAPGMTKADWGYANGVPVTRYTMTNGSGMSVNILTWGGVLQSIQVPGRDGDLANVLLGFDNIDDYLAKSPYFGAIIGRYANRIKEGTFTLDGQTYHLDINNDPNTLHGGYRGFDKYVWDAEEGEGNTLKLSRTSPDNEEYYPGTLKVDVTYSLNDDDELRIDYHATTDKKTIINLTNHAYFNLAGEGNGNVLGQVAQINASKFTPTDATAIPTGEIADVAGTPFDFTSPTPIGARIRDGSSQQLVWAKGYDHNWVLDRTVGDGKLFEAAVVTDPDSGRTVTCSTTEPGLQFYTGNFLDGSFAGTSGKLYRQGDAFTLETQHFPDSPNQPDFPSTVLNPGEEFKSSTVYKFSVSS